MKSISRVLLVSSLIVSTSEAGKLRTNTNSNNNNNNKKNRKNNNNNNNSNINQGSNKHANVHADGFDVIGGMQFHDVPTEEEDVVVAERERVVWRSSAKDSDRRKALEVKEYVRDESLEIVEPTPTTDDKHRKERTCSDGQRLFELQFVTDNYGYETSWSLEMKNSNNNGWDEIQSGPPGQSNYADNTLYRGAFCLDINHEYKLTINDLFQDGFCCSYGMGTYKFSLDGDVQYDSDYTRTFEDKATHKFYLSAVDGSSGASLPASGRTPSPYCNGNKEQVRIQISTDLYGRETSWSLRKAVNNKVIKEVKEGEYGEFDTDDVSICLEDGEYIFEIKDGLGDGMCCRDGNGFYKLYKDDDLMVYGSDFTSGKSRSHTIIVGYWKQLSMTTREQEYLNAHNQRREEWHKRLGKSYVPLKYSYGLADDAAHWANELLNDCHIVGIEHEHGVEQGENLAKNVGSGTWGSLYPVENIVRRWVEREEDWDFPANAHLTQALWRSSHYLGCAESSKLMDANTGEMCRIQVCRYARAGNCNMGAFKATVGDNWKEPMLMDESKCGPACPPEGCF